MWRMDEGKRGAAAPRQGSGRGLAYWTDGKGDERIVTVTPGLPPGRSSTRRPASRSPTFGKNGVVDLKTEIDQPGIDLETADIGLNSPPALGNNVIVVGAAHLPGGAPRTKENVKGYIRGYDVRTGKRLWIFHTIPQPGEFGNDTWENDSWSYTGNAGNWAPDHDRRRAQPRVSRHRRRHRRLLRRPSSGQQSVLRAASSASI